MNRSENTARALKASQRLGVHTFRVAPDPNVVPRAFREATDDREVLRELCHAYSVPFTGDNPELTRQRLRAALLAA